MDFLTPEIIGAVGGGAAGFLTAFLSSWKTYQKTKESEIKATKAAKAATTSAQVAESKASVTEAYVQQLETDKEQNRAIQALQLSRISDLENKLHAQEVQISELTGKIAHLEEKGLQDDREKEQLKARIVELEAENRQLRAEIVRLKGGAIAPATNKETGENDDPKRF